MKSAILASRCIFGAFASKRTGTNTPPHSPNSAKGQHGGSLSGSQSLDPMRLILFPEGTNLSPKTRPKSAQWAEKQGTRDLSHCHVEEQIRCLPYQILNFTAEFRDLPIPQISDQWVAFRKNDAPSRGGVGRG